MKFDQNFFLGSLERLLSYGKKLGVVLKDSSKPASIECVSVGTVLYICVLKLFICFKF